MEELLTTARVCRELGLTPSKVLNINLWAAFYRYKYVIKRGG